MAKRKKRMTKEELQAPDEIEAALRRFWEKMAKHKNLIIGGIVGLVGVGVFMWLVGSVNKSAADDRASAIVTAAAPIAASLGEPTPQELQNTAPKPERFADRSAALAAADERLSKYVAEFDGDDAREVVDLTLANVKLEAGDHAGALSLVEAWLAEHTESSFIPAALDLSGRAHIAAGDNAKALAAYKKLAQASTGDLKAMALAKTGDLQNPLIAGSGDASAAKAAYEEATAALGSAPPEQIPGLVAARGIRGELENKLALLPQ